ncbi:MAG: spore coat protein GerQ [Bacilli bacterium]|nr:spore coat protein GerQ [Bacilli bacterium]
MNNTYYPGGPLYSVTPNQTEAPSISIPYEQSYIENILRLNKGKVGKFHVTIPSSNDWRDKIFTGVIEQAGRDHIIVSNPTNGEWYLILMIYLDYVTFDEPINYIKQF